MSFIIVRVFLSATSTFGATKNRTPTHLDEILHRFFGWSGRGISTAAIPVGGLPGIPVSKTIIMALPNLEGNDIVQIPEIL